MFFPENYKITRESEILTKKPVNLHQNFVERAFLMLVIEVGRRGWATCDGRSGSSVFEVKNCLNKRRFRI